MILAILQNMYFRDVDRVKTIFAKHPDKRNYLISQFLFMGCLTGRRLLQTFGSDLCSSIVWEEAHPELGDHSSSKFGFDAKHIQQAIELHKPDTVIAFGKIAEDGLLAAMRLISNSDHPIGFYVIYAPHPAARQNPIPTLIEIAKSLRASSGNATARV